MDRELKAVYDEAVELAIKHWMKEEAEGKRLPVRRVKASAVVVLHSTKKEAPQHRNGATEHMPKREQRIVRLVELVRNRLRRGPYWAKVQTALVTESIADSLNIELAKIERYRIDAAQMTLPGFESLPKRIGSVAIADVSVKKLFAYKERYEKRSERDVRRLEELRTLTLRLAVFQATSPDIAVAEALRRLDAPKGLSIVAGA